MNKQTKSKEAQIRSKGASYHVEKACKRRAPTNLLARIFLDPKVKNRVVL